MLDLGARGEPLHSATRLPCASVPAQATIAWMEKEVRKTNNSELTSKAHNSTSLEVRELKDELSDVELNTVNGGGDTVSPYLWV